MQATVIASSMSGSPADAFGLVLLFLAVAAACYGCTDHMTLMKSRTPVIVGCFVMAGALVTAMATYGRPFTAKCSMAWRLADGAVYVENKELKFNIQDQMSCPPVGAIKAYVATPSFVEGAVTVANP